MTNTTDYQPPRTRRPRHKRRHWGPLYLLLAVLLPTCIAIVLLWPRSQTDAELLAAADTAERQGQIREAEIALKTLLQRSPDQPALRRRLGLVLLTGGRPADALNELAAGDPGESIDAAHLAALVEACAGAGQPARGLGYLARYKAQWPVTPALMLIESELLLASGQLDAAGALAEQIRDGGANTVGANLLLARVAIRRNELREAEALLQDILSTAPDNLDALILMAGLRANRGDAEGTEVMLSNVMRVAPADPRPDLMRLEIALANHEWESARRRLAELRGAGVAGLRVTRAEALLALADGEFAKAKQGLLALTGASADDPIALLSLAQLQVRDGEWHLAEQTLRTLRQSRPDWPPAQRLLAEVLLARGDGNGAMRLLSSLTARARTDAGLAALIGRARVVAGNPDEGRAWLEQAAQLAPEAQQRATELALADIASGRIDTGLANLNAAVDADPDNWQRTGVLLGALLNAEQIEQAVALARDRVQTYPEAPEAYLLLGGLQLALGDLVPATVTFEHLRELPGAAPLAALNLARVHLAAGDPTAARATLVPLADDRKLGPTPAIMLAHVERTHFGNPAGAKRWLERAQRLFPDDPRPDLAMAAFALDSGDAQAALIAASDVLARQPGHSEAVALAASAERALGAPEAAWTRLTTSDIGTTPNPGRSLLLADLALDLGRSEAARTHLMDATASGGLSVLLQTKAIRLALALDDTGMADTLLTRLRGSAPALADTAEVAILEATLAVAGGDKPRGEALLLEASRHYQSTEALQQWAALRLADGAAEEVLAQLDADPSLEADAPELRRLRGEALLTQGDPNAAIAVFEALRAERPDDVKNLVALSGLLWERRRPGDASRAMDHARRAEQVSPDDSMVIAHLGQLLLEQGQTARALEVLSAAAVKQPRDPSLQYRLALAEVGAGYSEQAKTRLHRLLQRHASFSERDAATALLRRLGEQAAGSDPPTKRRT